MKYYNYVIKRDFGFAPNPYYEYCTLATCKPMIRKSAQVGDWIAAFGASDSIVARKLVLLMKVSEVLSFDEYWTDARFLKKRPCLNRGVFSAYGDNIYHHIGDDWTQEPSHHSHLDGTINLINLKKDTQTDKVLISTEFYYFGNNAISVPKEFDSMICKQRTCKVFFDIGIIDKFVNFVQSKYEVGIHGIPYSRKKGKIAHYSGK